MERGTEDGTARGANTDAADRLVVGEPLPTLMSQLLRVPARCPRCQWSPAIRITVSARTRMLGVDPNTPMLTVKCSRRRGSNDCGEVYMVTAGDFQKAR